MVRILADRPRRAVLVSLVISAVGIPIQILGGWDYPVVPPGMLILLAAGLAALLPVRWAPAISLVAGGFILVGFFVVGDLANMFGSQNALVTAGKWVQMVALVVGVAAAIGSLVKPPLQPAAAHRPSRGTRRYWAERRACATTSRTRSRMPRSSVR